MKYLHSDDRDRKKTVVPTYIVSEALKEAKIMHGIKNSLL